MTHSCRRMVRRCAAISLLGAAALVTACERRLPTSAEIDAMDVAGAERATSQAGVFHMSRIPSVVHFYVDGVKATREAAAALPGNVILSMRMTKTGDSGDTIVTRITTDGTRERDPAYEAAESRRWVAKRDAERASDSARGREAMQAETTTMEAEARRTAGSSSAGRMVRTRTAGFDGLVVIDGILSTSEALMALDPMRIVETEVLKERVAVRESSDPRAAFGIIKVTTRR
jgi:hypothetical protein